MSGAKWIGKPKPLPPRGRRPPARSEPRALPVRVFLDERALRRWLTQGKPESEPRAPSAGPEDSRPQDESRSAQANSEE